MPATELRETVYLGTDPNVDADAGFIRGVKLLGMESRNGRRYTREAMTKAAPLYVGRKIHLDHPKPSEVGADRSVKDWVGTIQSARFESDAIFGDVKLRKQSPYFGEIIEAAQDFPNDIGFSHVADGSSRFEGETEIVESIGEVFTVDLVADPATTAGFFESKRKKKQTIKSALESLPESPVRTKLIEAMYAGHIDGDLVMDPDDKPADPLSQMQELVKTLITQLGEALKALAMKKDTPPPVQQPPAPNAQDESPEAIKVRAESLAKENAELKTENASLKAKLLLLESGREATDIRVKTLSALTEEADRKALLESWSKPEEGARPFRSPPLLESEDTADDFPRDSAEKFAASLR